MMVFIRIPLVVISVVLLQITLFDELRIAGIAPECAMGLAVAAGLAGGSDKGAMVGFLLGLFLDLYIATPYALSALTFAVVAFIAGFFDNSMANTSWLVAGPMIGIGTASGVAMYVLFGEILGEDHFYTDRFLVLLIVTGFAGFLLGGPLMKAMRWCFSDGSRPGPTPIRRFGVVN